MPRYIDLEEFERRINENVKAPRYWSYEQREVTEWCKDECIRQAYCMLADVASRSEIVKIFEQIDKITCQYLNDDEYSVGEMIYDLDQLKEKCLKPRGHTNETT